jgi:organic radical activating enzyme
MTQNNYCPYIYKGIYIEKTLDQYKLSACCVNTVSTPESKINFHTNQYLTKQRNQFDLGEKPSSCNNCWQQEERGIRSRRTRNQLLRMGATDTQVELLSIDYNVPPLCNAKCIICTSYFSSAWAQEDIKFGVAPERTFNEIHTNKVELDLDLSKVRRIYFNGGEPLLSPDINMMLSNIKKQQGSLSNVNLSMNTNGSILLKPEDLLLWNECESVTMLFSIDAIGKQFEYIRNPLIWKDVSTNVRKYEEMINNLNVMISPNIGIHNVLEFENLVQWFNEQQSTSKAKSFVLNVTPTNGIFSFDETSLKIKESIIPLLNDTIEVDIVKNYIQNSKSGENRWIHVVDKLDSRRDSNWREVFPKLGQLYDESL